MAFVFLNHFLDLSDVSMVCGEGGLAPKWQWHCHYCHTAITDPQAGQGTTEAPRPLSVCAWNRGHPHTPCGRTCHAGHLHSPGQVTLGMPVPPCTWQQRAHWPEILMAADAITAFRVISSCTKGRKTSWEVEAIAQCFGHCGTGLRSPLSPLLVQQAGHQKHQIQRS